MIQKNKNYSVEDLKELLGQNWLEQVQGVRIPISPKPVINNFNEFDEQTKIIYTHIFNIIKEKNPNQDIKVWATGSRVKGTWKTKEESDAVANANNSRPKYSDYDYVTDAIRKPSKIDFFNALNVAVDFAGGGGHKVLITI